MVRSLTQRNKDLPSEAIFGHFGEGGKIIKKLKILTTSEIVGGTSKVGGYLRGKGGVS